MIQSLQAIVHNAVARVPYSATAVAAGAMDDWSRLYNYTLAVKEPVSMRDLMEGELYNNLARIFDGLRGFYGADATPETIYHFFGTGLSGTTARDLYGRYLMDKKAFLASPVYPPTYDLNDATVQEELRQRLAAGVDYDVSQGLSAVPTQRLYKATIIRDQWGLTKDKIMTLPFESLKQQIFSRTPLELKGDWMPSESVFIGLKEYEMIFYLALGPDVVSLSLKREYEEWQKKAGKPRQGSLTKVP